MKRVRLMGCMVACGVLLSAGQVFAADVCAEGDEKCGPDGNILRCKRMYNEAKWMNTFNKCEGPAATSQGSSTYSRTEKESKSRCTDGDTKCGADGYIATCDNGKWKSSYKRCP